MILGFQVSRRAYLKTLAPIIDEAVRRGHQVIAILDRPPRKPGAEPAHPTDFLRWPTIQLTTLATHLDALVGMAFERPPWCDGPYIQVNEFWDNLLVPPALGMTYCSEYHWQTHYRAYGITGSPPPVVGWVPGDQAARIDLGAFITRYGLPGRGARPIWTVFPPKEAMPCYRDIIRALTERAKQDGAYVIVRMRPKAHERWWMRWQGHKRIWDDQMVPNASLACLLLSDLAIHFTSGVAFEAAYVGCPAVSIGVTKPPALLPMGTYYSTEFFTRLNWPGVNQHVSQWEAAKFLRDGMWPTLHEAERHRYIQKFMYRADGGAAGRVLDVVEQAV